jgi:ketosteroid isomerase-like protein
MKFTSKSVFAFFTVLLAGTCLSHPTHAEFSPPSEPKAVFRLAQANPASPSLTAEKDAIHKVIHGYYDAVGRSPVEAAAFYGEPALLVLPNQVGMLAKRSDVEDFLAKLLAGLKPQGYSHSKVVDPRIRLLNSTTAIYSTIAIRFRADGSELQRAGFTYLLQKDSTGWKIHELIATDLDKLVTDD